MTTILEAKPREYRSGDIVEPGDYMDLETGAMVHVREQDELPEGTRIVHYHRHFQRVDGSQDRPDLGYTNGASEPLPRKERELDFFTRR